MSKPDHEWERYAEEYISANASSLFDGSERSTRTETRRRIEELISGYPIESNPNLRQTTAPGVWFVNDRSSGQILSFGTDRSIPAALSTNETRLAIPSADCGVDIIDTVTFKTAKTLRCDGQGGAWFIWFSQNGGALIAGIEQYDEHGIPTFRNLVWDSATGNIRSRFTLPEGTKLLALSPDGWEFAAASESALQFRDVTTSRVVQTIQRPSVGYLTYLPDGRFFVIADGTDSGRVEVWRRQPLQLVHTLVSRSEPIDEMAVSPSGRLLAVRGLAVRQRFSM